MTTLAEAERVDQYLEQALQLSPAARDRLAIGLLDSLLQSDDDSATRRNAWTDDLARRIEDVEAGRVKLMDADEALDRLEKKYREKHQR